VAIGLAGGFLEPLESTSLYLVQQAITALVELFPERRASSVDRDEFNRIVNMEYDRVRDFLILHYHATERDDSEFWNYVRTMPIPDSLAEKMELFRRRGRIVKYREGAFLDASWVSVYLGQRVMPAGYDPRAAGPSVDSLVAGMEQMQAEIRTAVGAMPDHRTYLGDYCPMPVAA
jgi:tryptophan halogenase